MSQQISDAGTQFTVESIADMLYQILEKENMESFQTDNTNVFSISRAAPPKPPTPIYDEISESFNILRRLSHYNSNFNLRIYRDLETRYPDGKLRGGIVFRSPLKLVNSHSTCQQCLYSFELDTYGRGCVHDCVYCYAKAELTVHGWWNNPIPAPVDITTIWNAFYTVFETDKKSKWRSVLERRIPVRIGSMSDSFMFMDKKYGVTKELLRILKHYNYPYVVFTRSDLVADDEYLSLLDRDLCSVQFSISSTNEELVRKVEPGAPSPKRRLQAAQKLTQAGIWTTVRLNPFFPIYPDGYFTNPEFDRSKMPKPFNFSSIECVDEFAEYGVKSMLVGMVRLSGYALNQIEKAVGRNLREFFADSQRKSARDFHYSDSEVRAYYQLIKERCAKNNIEFTTCYIGNGENHFWKDQDLWSNKKDCCNIQGKVSAFATDSRSIEWSERLKHTNYKTSTPNDPERLHAPLTGKTKLYADLGVKTPGAPCGLSSYPQ